VAPTLGVPALGVPVPVAAEVTEAGARCPHSSQYPSSA